MVVVVPSHLASPETQGLRHTRCQHESIRRFTEYTVGDVASGEGSPVAYLSGRDDSPTELIDGDLLISLDSKRRWSIHQVSRELVPI